MEPNKNEITGQNDGQSVESDLLNRVMERASVVDVGASIAAEAKARLAAGGPAFGAPIPLPNEGGTFRPFMFMNRKARRAYDKQARAQNRRLLGGRS